MGAGPGWWCITDETLDGRIFRPSDWATRLASLFSEFDRRRRLRYPAWIQPIQCRHNQGVCIDLDTAPQDAVRFIRSFVVDNALRAAEPRTVRNSAPRQDDPLGGRSFYAKKKSGSAHALHTPG